MHKPLILLASLASLSVATDVAMAQRVASTTLRRPRPLPPPALMVRQQKKSVPLQLTKVAIRAKVVGHLAETEVTMTFYNPNRRRHEGDLYFPLPEGSTVSGYALDVKGMMVDGVVVEKDRARQVFEAEVRKGIDPGLVEWTKGRNFKTRIFPIPPRGTRTVRVSYVSEVVQTRRGAVYYLPLSYRKKVKRLSLRVEVVKAAAKPTVLAGGPRGLRFGAWRDSFVAKATLKNVKLTKDLQVALPRLERRPVRVEQADDGTVYFSIRDVVTHQVAGTKKAKPRKIALYWDASLSRKGAHAKELKLLERYLAGLGQQGVQVQLVVFRNAAERTRRFELPAGRKALLSALRGVSYDGGTQVGAVKRVRGKVDLVLFFSDGISSFGKEKPPKLGGAVYAINDGAVANHAFLKYLALRSGGAYLNLKRVSVAAALRSIGREALSFISAEARGVAAESVYPRLRTPVHGTFTLAGKLKGKVGQVTVRYGVGQRVTHQRTFTIRRTEVIKGDLLRRDWAQKRLEELLVFPERNQDAMTELGKAYGIVTPGTSLLVLERLSQYVEHEVRPPASWVSMRKKYDAAMARKKLAQKKKERSKLKRVLALWKSRVAWWKKRYKYPKNFRYRDRSVAKGARRRRRPSARRPRPPRLQALRRANGGSARHEEADARAGKKGKRKAGGPQVKIKAWDPKTPYLAALKAAPARRRYAVYLQQRDKHGQAPAFYLDCAHYFRRVKQRRLALRILSNLAELELANPALLRVLAHRLAQVGQLDLSIAVFEKVRKLRPEEPQSFRDLALVLERRADRSRRRRRRRARADYGRAMALLSKVVMNKWQRFDEIEVIALTELNNMLPKARRLGLRKLPVDRRLIKRLTMDVRIVMTWDADLTDMDLHVVEPSGEEAYYSHNRTTIGGLVSRDFTQGYGPEVYAVRRAMRGRYRIRTKYFGSSAAKLSGGVTLQVDIYTNYGRRNQKRRSLTLRLTKRKETFDVGSIRF